MTKITDAEPTFQNSATKIWQGRLLKKEPSDPFLIEQWIVHAPWMHMLWSYHYCSLIHLRDANGFPSAKMQFPEATHEFGVFALNPDYEPDTNKLHYLMPISIAQQFVADSDATALLLIETCMERVLKGQLTLDSDGYSVWKHILRGDCTSLGSLKDS